MAFAPKEQTMWTKPPRDTAAALTDDQINDKYLRGEGRIIIETNREKLPGFVSAMKSRGYMDLRPFYQRRPRWDKARQSLLIESFLMNIPVPPVFLYEKDFNEYEVMDGQQRITSLRDFFDDKFALEGLTEWSDINGRTYSTLPSMVKAGLDRRSISSIVLLKESTSDEESASRLRETVFERLNSGGVRLSRQELRNALYPGPFNQLLDELSRKSVFRRAWGLPDWVENEVEVQGGITENSMFKDMEDIEVILRFFALRHVDHYRNGMAGFLDLYMRKAQDFEEADVATLRTEFVAALEVAAHIYGDDLFKIFDPKTGVWGKPQKAFADAVLVGLSRLAPRVHEVWARSPEIKEATKAMFAELPAETFTGRGNSKGDIQKRIQAFVNMATKALG